MLGVAALVHGFTLPLLSLVLERQGVGTAVIGLNIIPLTLLGRNSKAADLSAAASVFAVMFCFGAVLGPPMGGVGIALLGNDGMRWALMLIYTLALLLPIMGLIRRWRA